ncbi:MAG TPA: GWxTD domain-containing protein [Thermoanaerobaculia bacterium]|nr:GWxTD domain-containing protein [Thermoanaerobaculia bacterium]
MTCSAIHRPTLRLSVLTLAAALALACGSSGPRRINPADLTNPFLGPEQSGWLIGPIARIATPEEIQAYLALTDNAQADAFIEQFWARRDPNPQVPGNPLLSTFEERTAEADRLYSEAGYRGRRTDRGAVFVLYGEPTKVEYEISPARGQAAIEAWSYAPTTPAGLDGRKPSPLYRFIKRGDLTETYIPRESDPRLRQREGPMPPPL